MNDWKGWICTGCGHTPHKSCYCDIPLCECICHFEKTAAAPQTGKGPQIALELIPVEPQPTYIVTASREWWEYAPAEAKPHPDATALQYNEKWYWVVAAAPTGREGLREALDKLLMEHWLAVGEQECGTQTGFKWFLDKLVAFVEQREALASEIQPDALPCGHEKRFWHNFGESTHLPTGIKLPETWACALCTIERIAATSSSARKQALEDACRAQCEFCAQGLSIQPANSDPFLDGRTWHVDGGIFRLCRAAKIRALAGGTGEQVLSGMRLKQVQNAVSTWKAFGDPDGCMKLIERALKGEE